MKKKKMENELDIKCLQCKKLLAKYNLESDTHYPNPEKLIEEKKIAVPHVGWFGRKPNCRINLVY